MTFRFFSVLMPLSECVIVSLSIVSVLILAMILEPKIKVLVTSGILMGYNSRITGALVMKFLVLDS